MKALILVKVKVSVLDPYDTNMNIASSLLFFFFILYSLLFMLSWFSQQQSNSDYVNSFSFASFVIVLLYDSDFVI